MILYYNNDGILKMMSEEKIKTDLNSVEVDLSNDDKAKIKNIEWERKIENGELIFSLSEKSKKREDTIAEINAAKTIPELKEIILKLI